VRKKRHSKRKKGKGGRDGRIFFVYLFERVRIREEREKTEEAGERT